MNKGKDIAIYTGESELKKGLTNKGDGYSIAIKNTFTNLKWNYVTLAITGPDGVEKCSTVPISCIGKQLFKQFRVEAS